MSRMLLVLAVLTLTLAVTPSWAQDDDMPSVGGPSSSDSGSGVGTAEIGTNIIGERESPIGLYITPWRESRAESGMDRPARLLQEKLTPIDEAVFVRQIEYHNALTQALDRKGVVSPVER